MNLPSSPEGLLVDQLENLRSRVTHYEGVLHRNAQSRWYDQGRRHLADLQVELAALEAQVASSADTLGH